MRAKISPANRRDDDSGTIERGFRDSVDPSTRSEGTQVGRQREMIANDDAEATHYRHRYAAATAAVVVAAADAADATARFRDAHHCVCIGGG